MLMHVENLRFYHSTIKDCMPLAESVPIHTTAIWETCLRKIIFFEANDPHTVQLESLNDRQQLRLYEGAAGLEFLLSVLCGLDSKVVGETEIFFQFKNFVNTPEAQKISFFRNPKALQFLFQEVKSIRDTYLKGLGVHSYGSLIRKMSKDLDRVCVIGYGLLAEEVIPWFKNKNIDVHVRNPNKYKAVAGLDFQALGASAMAPLVVIAAPVKTTQLLDYFKNHGAGIQQVIDCRSLSGDQTSLIESLNIPVVELKDLFNLLSGQQDQIRQALPLIRTEISARVQQYMARYQHRPMGWDDIC